MTPDESRSSDGQGRWQPGPDPDAPPWAGEDDDDEQATPRPDDDSSGGGGPTDEAEQPGEERGQGERGGRDAPGGSTPAPLARLAGGDTPPRPPRRTGVFVDHEDLREHVGGLLRAILGGYEVDAFGNFTFLHEDARVFVTVGPSPIGPQVGVFSVTNLEIELTPELARFLLITNHRLGFGSFSYDPDHQAVWLRHALLGTTLDGPELQTAVAAVASTAAAFDDRIRDEFGGRTFTEAPSEVQQRMEPPDPSQGPAAPGGYL